MVYTTHRAARTPAVFVLAVAAIFAAFAEPLRAGQQGAVSGPARVIDGDTVEINGVRIRLEGIDAPERGQRCRGRWLPIRWACGTHATRALRKLTRGQTVRCQTLGYDKYQRVIARCFVDGRDINAAMVRRGHAWAFTKYSATYIAEEQQARLEKRGIWRAKTETASAFRAKKWQAAEQVVPKGCPIKGNISARGRVYHTPWSPWYRRVRINTGKGERWFCSEAEAQAAGWRPVSAG